MKRKITAITLVCLLVGAAAALAANDYTGTKMTFSHGVGKKKKPVAIGFKQTIVANNTDSTKAAEVLVDIKTKVYGLRSGAAHFPTCSAAKMEAMKSDSFCPKKSKFAHGLVNALLGNPSLDKSSRVKCNPNLDVFNAGHNKLWFFFTTSSALQCAGLTTGVTPPYPGKVSYSGKYEVLDVPLPPDVSTKVANQPNFYGSLIKETLNWYKLTTRVKGKTVGNNQSIGCLHGKRPYSITLTSTTNGSNRSSKTVKGSAKC